MTLPIDNATLLGDFVPNVYISRIMLSYGTQTTTVRGDSPHYDIPTKEQYQANVAQQQIGSPTIDPLGNDGLGGQMQLGQTTLYESVYSGLYGAEKKKTGISTYSNDDPGKNNKTLKVRVDLVVKDVIENKLLSNWFNEEKLKEYINLSIVQSTDVKSTEMLDSIDPAVDFGWYGLTSIPGKTSLKTINLGEIYPSNGEGETSPAHNQGGTKVQYDPNRFNSYEYTTNDLGQRVYNITFSTTFTVEKPNVNHLAYFVVANVDKKFFEDSFEPSIDIGNVPGLYKHLTGKKAFEFVIKDGKTITDAYYYVDRDNAVWLGDIHFMYNLPEEGLVSAKQVASLREDQLVNMVGIPMKGKTHAEGLASVDSEEDMFLTEVKATNTTIQDFRQRDVVDKLDIDFSEANKLFSAKDITEEKFKNQKIADGTVFHTDFWASRDMDNRLNFCFGVDMRALLVKYSQYSKLWENLSKKDKHSLLISKFFKSLTIVRKRVKAIDDTNLFDENIPVQKIAKRGYSSPKTGLVTKLSIELGGAPGYEYCFFSGYDESMRDISDGFYQYGIKFTFEDTLKKLILKKIRSLETSLKLAKQLYTISTQPQYYNLISDTYTKLYKEEQNDEYFGIIPDLLSKFNQMYSLVTSTNSVKKEGFLENLLNISSPNTGTPDGLEFIINMIEEFLEKILSIFSLKSVSAISDSGTNAYSPSGVKSSKQIAFLDGETYFGEIFDASMRNSGYEYLSYGVQSELPEKLGIKRISYLDFEERALAENLKYFTDETAAVPIKLKYKNKGIQFESNLIEDKYTFLSPSCIKMPESGKIITLPFTSPEDPNYDSQSSPVNIQYEALNSFYLEIIKKLLIGQDAGVLLNKNNTAQSQKSLLTSVLSAKGLSFGLAATEGIPAKEALVQQLIENDGPLVQAVIPQLELDEEKQVPPEFVEEPNYNDALFFMSNPNNRKDNIKLFEQFPTFLKALRGNGFLPLNENDLKGIPNHFKQLITLDPSPEDTGVDTTYLKDNLNFFENNIENIGDLATGKNNFGIFINYFNLVQIEYLEGFIFNNIKGPHWSKLTPETFSNIKSNDKPVLCRLRYYTNKKLGVTRDSAVDLPIYDKYFILASMKELSHLPNYKGGDEMIKDFNKMSKHKKTMDNVDSENLGAGGPSKGKKANEKSKKLGTTLSVEGGFTGDGFNSGAGGGGMGGSY
tara:strand:+ start:3057 stop:6632 length:3576 start_codon:yes stop_codon:yes gene_type:complete